MKISRNTFKDNILLLAEMMQMKIVFNAYFDYHNAIPEIVKDLVYELFLFEFMENYQNDDQLAAYQSILEYAKELRQYGFVSF